jgi:DNA-binding winged-HTH domains
MKSGESSRGDTRCRFGGYVLDPRARELRRLDGTPVPLTAKAFDVLCVLVRERERVVARDELFAEVWPGRVVEENTLTQAVSALRHALGDGERYVVTVPGRGYRFVAGVTPDEAPPDAAALHPDPFRAAATPAPPPARTRAPWFALAAAAALVVALLAWTWLLPPSPAPETVRVAEPAAATPAATVVVLPFQARPGGDEQDEWLGPGLANALGQRLDASPALHVYPSDSGRRLAALAPDPLQAARRLGVDYLVEGSTVRRGADIEVEVRLRAVADGATRWTQRFAAAGERVFTLPAQVVDGLFSALAVAPPAPGHGSPCDGADAEAYRAYLRGQYHMGRPSPERSRRAVAEFQQALERDPTCARAYAGLAHAYRSLAVVADAEPNVIFPLARAAAERALVLDPALAEAHVALGWIQLWYDWDWAGAEASFLRALELDPGLPEAHFGYANLLVHTGRRAEAAAPMRRALALDPLSPLFNALGAWALGGPQGAAEYIERALELDPDYFLALAIRSGMRQRNGDADGALADLQRARQLCGDCSHVLAILGRTQADLGQPAATRAILREMEARDRDGYWPASSLAALHNALGEADVALELLERAMDERDTRMAFLLMDGPLRWSNLQQDPRFLSLLSRMALPVAETTARTNTPASPTSAAAERNSR